MKKIYVLIAFVIFFFVPVFLCADIIYLDEEKTIEGEIISETENTVTVKMLLGQGGGDIVYTLNKIDIKKIEEKPYGVVVEKEPEKEETGYMKFFSGISERFSNVFNMKLSENENLSTALSDITGYLSSSFFVGIVIDLLLALLALSCLTALKMDGADAIVLVENGDAKKFIGRWVFAVITLVLVQAARFNSFNFITSGWASYLILGVILYETIGLCILLFFRKQYVDMMKKASESAPISLKVPMALEFLILAYLFVMDVLDLFL